MEQGSAMAADPETSEYDTAYPAVSSPEAMMRLGAAIGAGLQAGEAVCLWGPLGAGKSTLARGLIRALTTPDEEVPSPTFTLVQAYQGPRLALAHFDLYRLKEAS